METITLKEFPNLYTRSSLKVVRYWNVKAIREGDLAYVYKTYGQMNGKCIINKTLIPEGKSKKDQFLQAIFEAESSWNEKTNKKGYVTDIESLNNITSQLSKTQPQPQPTLVPVQVLSKIAIKTKSAIIEKSSLIPIKVKSGLIPLKMKPTTTESSGLIPLKVKSTTTSEKLWGDLSLFKFLPMLANKYLEKKSYVKYPCFIQDKFDGVRCTSRKLASDGSVVLKSRSDAIFPFFFEIKAEISKLQSLVDQGILLDGELYSYKIPFRTLNGYCNRKKLDGKSGYDKIPKEHLTSIHYQIFDCYFIGNPTMVYEERYKALKTLLEANTSPYLVLAKCDEIYKEEDIIPRHDQSVLAGHEGIMIRNKSGIYKLKDRSNDLLKYKEFEDREFTIVGAFCPETGKEEQCIIWQLGIPESSLTFTCRPRESYEARKLEWLEYQENPDAYIGQSYTVRFQGTYENGIPRFPVGIAIRYDI